MERPPDAINDLPVVLYSPLDWRHEATGLTAHTVGGEELAGVSGLAICRDGSAYFLFYCDNNWEPLTDTWHQSLADAQSQAASEYLGVAETWESAT